MCVTWNGLYNNIGDLLFSAFDIFEPRGGDTVACDIELHHRAGLENWTDDGSIPEIECRY